MITLAPRAGAVRAGVGRFVRRLPRGRARIARGLAKVMRETFADTVPPESLGIVLRIDPRDPFQLEIWLGAYQPHVIAFLMASVKPGARVLCAGLHVGYVASVARALAGADGLVLSAEPDAVARDAGLANLALNDSASLAPVMVFEGGFSDVADVRRMYASRTLGHSSFAAPHQFRVEEEVATIRADDWLESLGVRAIDVLVLDVEGWELRALAGMTNTIARSGSLAALVEVSDWALRAAGSSRGDLLQYWWERGFSVHWAREYGAAHARGVWGSPADALGPAQAADVLCIREGEHAV